MQCKYYQILLGQTCEWFLWRGGHFVEVVFKTSTTVCVKLSKLVNTPLPVGFLKTNVINLLLSL